MTKWKMNVFKQGIRNGNWNGCGNGTSQPSHQILAIFSHDTSRDILRSRELSSNY